MRHYSYSSGYHVLPADDAAVRRFTKQPVLVAAITPAINDMMLAGYHGSEPIAVRQYETTRPDRSAKLLRATGN